MDADISQDGTHAVIASVNHGAGYWRLKDNELLYEWSHGKSKTSDIDDQTLDKGIFNTAISPDNSKVITTEKNAFVLWDVKSGKSDGYWKTKASIRDVTLSRQGKHIALALSNHIILYVNMTTGRRLEISGHGEAVNAVRISANGRYLFSAGNDFRAILWDLEKVKPIFIWEHENRVTTLALSDDGAYAFSSGIKGDANIWDLRTGKLHLQLGLLPREYTTSTATFSPDNRYLATGHAGRFLMLWDVKTGKKVDKWLVSTRNKWKPTGAIVYAIGFTPDSQHVLSESSSGYFESWKISHRLLK